MSYHLPAYNSDLNPPKLIHHNFRNNSPTNGTQFLGASLLGICIPVRASPATTAGKAISTKWAS